VNTLDNLLEVFEQDAGRAPTPHGVAEAAAAGAGRIRRRRRVIAVAGAAILVAAAAVVVPLATHHDATGPLPARPAPYRNPGQVTVSLAPGTKFVGVPSADGSRQSMVLVTGSCCDEVRVYDPGTYDAAALVKGEPVVVAGHPAHYAVVAPPAPDRVTRPVPTVGWQDVSGAWVTVFHSTNSPKPAPAGVREKVLGLAAKVRLGKPREISVPFHLPAVPRDLPVTYVMASAPGLKYFDHIPTGDGALAYAKVGFGGDGRPTGATAAFPPPASVSLMITSWTKGMTILGGYPKGKPTTTVDGHNIWYYDGPRHLPAPASSLVVQAGTCYVEFLAQDRTKFTKADLIAMLAGATFDDCGQPSTWKGPM